MPGAGMVRGDVPPGRNRNNEFGDGAPSGTCTRMDRLLLVREAVQRLPKPSRLLVSPPGRAIFWGTGRLGRSTRQSRPCPDQP